MGNPLPVVRLLWPLFGVLLGGIHVAASQEYHPNCPAPRSPDNGMSLIFNNGRIVRYRCHPGYKLRGHPHAVCTNSHWNRPTPVCLPKNGTRRNVAVPENDINKEERNVPSRQLFDWSSSHATEETKLPLINGEWQNPHHRRSQSFSVSPPFSNEQAEPDGAMLKKQLIEEEINVPELRPNQEQDVLNNRVKTKDSLERTGADEIQDNDSEGKNESNDVTPQPAATEHNVATSHSMDSTSQHPSKRYYRWKEDEPKPHGARYYSSRIASTGRSNEQTRSKTDLSHSEDENGEHEVPTSTEAPKVHTSSWLSESGPREALRKQSDISDYWRSHSGGYSAEKNHNRREPSASTVGESGASTQKPVNRAFKRSYLHSDDDYVDDDDDDEDEFDEYQPAVRVKFDRGDSTPKPMKGDPEPYDNSAGRSLPTSSPVDYFGRPVQVLTGEKAHQQDALLRRQYERAQLNDRELRQRPVSFDTPQEVDETVTSRPIDYFGRQVQVHTGEKAALAEALLRKQYEMVQQRMRDNAKELEVRKPPEEFLPRQPLRPEDDPRERRRGDIPVRVKGDREVFPTREPPRNLVTSRPYDYFGRPVQVLTGEKAAHAEALLREQYETYQQQLNRRDRTRDNEAVGRPVEFTRQAVEPPGGGVVTSPPFDSYGRPVQVLTGEKAGQQTELLRRQYEMAEGRKDNFQEVRRRPVEEVHHPRLPEHRHRHNHGEPRVNSESSREFPGSGTEGTSGTLRLSKEDLELMSKLSPDVRASFLRDLRKARTKEETDPDRANQFLSRYESTWKNRAAMHTKSLATEPETDEDNGEDDDDDDDEYDDMQNDQPEDIPLTTASTEDTSSESREAHNSTRNATSTFTSSKASYDQTCLRDRKQGTSFLSAPKVKHAYVHKYERKVLAKPPHTHYVLARYKCLFGYKLKYEKADALYCRQREWIGEHPHCVRGES